MAFKLRSPLPMPDVAGRKMVIYHRVDSLWGWAAKMQGLYAEFHAVLGALKYAETHKAAAVEVQFSSDLYRDPFRDGNWWGYFFEPVMPVAGRADADPVHFSGLYRYGPHFFNDSWAFISIPGNSGALPYPLGDPGQLATCRRLTASYIRLKQHVLDEAARIFQTFDAPFVLGVHYRGTDKANHYPDQNPEHDFVFQEIDRLIAHYAPARWAIFCATDERKFEHAARQRYGSRLFTLENSPLGDHAPGTVGVHKDPSIDPYWKGLSAVLSTQLLAMCSHLLKNRSALSDAALAFNPTLPWTMILGGETAYCSILSGEKR